jgi:hypothetical protein
MSAANLIDYNTGKIQQSYLPDFIANDLLSPVAIKPASGSAGNFELIVNGNNASAYGGGLTLNPGSNSVAPNGAVGVNIRATATGCAVEIGTDGATGTINTLGVAGPEGIGNVYNTLYNPVQPYILSLGETSEAPIDSVAGAIGKVTNVISIPITSGATGAVSCPATYNLFTMSLDFSFQVVTTGGTDSYKLYLAAGATSGYNAANNITFLRFGGDGTYNVSFKDQPLELFFPSGNVDTLYVNIQNETAVEGGDVTGFTYDYAVRCDRALALVIPS